MMLELLLPRADRKGRQVLENARGLDWLVLDELHTYRGRQGADDQRPAVDKYEQHDLERQGDNHR